jgi:hypothetical protein
VPRRPVFVLSAALLALAAIAACGSPPGPTGEESRVGDYVDSRVTTTLPGAVTVPGETTAPTVSPLTVAPTSAAPDGRRSPGTTFDIGSNPTDDPVFGASQGPAGWGAGMILQSVDAPKLVVELINQENAVFNQQALDRILSDLRQFSGKQPEVVRTGVPAGPTNKLWTPGEMRDFVDTHSKRKSGGDTFVLHYAAVRGGSEGSDATLGVAIRADTFFYFEDRAGRFDQKTIRAVYVHEQGHLLGLVDNYLSRNRHDTAYDPARSGHSKNQRSVMYYAVNPALNLGTPFDTASDQFDTEDLRDLQAIKAGAPRGSNPKF